MPLLLPARRALAAMVAMLALACAALPARAADLPPPSGPALLTLSGAITRHNAGDTAVFDLNALEAMQQQTFSTTTIWTDGEQEFTGVALRDLLGAVGATGNHVRATAINDYAIDIPLPDGDDPGPIVAYRNNGALMSVRDKGPLWIVYPYDSDPAYQTEQIFSRSIWQLDRIVVVE